MPHTPEELDRALAQLGPSPAGASTVDCVCVRPGPDLREYPAVLELSAARGAVGDRWERRTWMCLPDGRPDPRVQVAVCNSRIIDLVRRLAGTSHHPGDTLMADLDLSEAALPVGSRLRVGTAVIEVSDVENDACAKFARHYGESFLHWIRLPENRHRRLRGLFARVVQDGQVRVGDPMGRA
ncbi:hypothetical protein GALL_280910 [mine drainage metagenome]|uniref:MOSC domain-containing protein n=1 Tax=mine drainage metagenome TaxID=410659 RepID=A0A1J5R224_9ZZZZ